MSAEILLIGTNLAVTLLVIGLLALVWWHVRAPHRYKCPQCKGSRTISPSKALTKIRCTYCGGAGEVWR